jgi:hypothetical protein
MISDARPPNPSLRTLIALDDMLLEVMVADIAVSLVSPSNTVTSTRSICSALTPPVKD